MPEGEAIGDGEGRGAAVLQFMNVFVCASLHVPMEPEPQSQKCPVEHAIEPPHGVPTVPLPRVQPRLMYAQQSKPIGPFLPQS